MSYVITYSLDLVERKFEDYDFREHLTSLQRLKDPQLLMATGSRYGIGLNELHTVAEQAYFVALGTPLVKTPESDSHLDILELVFASHCVDDVCDSPILPDEHRRALVDTIRRIDVKDLNNLEENTAMLLEILESAKKDLGYAGPDFRTLTFEHIVPRGDPNRKLLLLSYVKLTIAGLIQTSRGKLTCSDPLHEELDYYFALAANEIAHPEEFYKMDELPHEGIMVASASGLLEWFAFGIPGAVNRGAMYESWNGILGTMVHLSNNQDEVQLYERPITYEEMRDFVQGCWKKIQLYLECNQEQKLLDKLELIRFVLGHMLFKTGGSNHSYENYPPEMQKLQGTFDDIMKDMVARGWINPALIQQLL